MRGRPPRPEPQPQPAGEGREEWVTDEQRTHVAALDKRLLPRRSLGRLVHSRKTRVTMRYGGQGLTTAGRPRRIQLWSPSAGRPFPRHDARTTTRRAGSPRGRNRGCRSYPCAGLVELRGSFGETAFRSSCIAQHIASCLCSLSAVLRTAYGARTSP